MKKLGNCILFLLLCFVMFFNISCSPLTGIAGMKNEPFGIKNKPLIASEWTGVEKLAVYTSVNSTVNTEKADLGSYALGAASAVTGVVTSTALSGLSLASTIATPYSASVTGGAVAGGLFTAEGKKDSVHFSRMIKENLGDWSLNEAFNHQLAQSLRLRSPIPVENRDFMDDTQQQSGIIKSINTSFMINFSGRGKPYLFIMLTWYPRLNNVLVDEDQPFILSKNSSSYISENYRNYITQSRKYTRKEWVNDNCALLKEEISRALTKLSSEMAEDMFGDLERQSTNTIQN